MGHSAQPPPYEDALACTPCQPTTKEKQWKIKIKRHQQSQPMKTINAQVQPEDLNNCHPTDFIFNHQVVHGQYRKWSFTDKLNFYS